VNTDAEILDSVMAKMQECVGHMSCGSKATCIVGSRPFCDVHGEHAAASSSSPGKPKPLDWAREIRAWEKLRGVR